MKKQIIMIFCVMTILGLGIYIQSQNEDIPEKKQPVEPVANITTTKLLLKSLIGELLLLQAKMSKYSEQLAGMYARWKREGKIRQAEQWSQTKNGIIQLLSQLKIIANSVDLIEKLRRDKDIFEVLSQLNKAGRSIIDRKGAEKELIRQLTSLYGKTIFTDKLGEKLTQFIQVIPFQPKPTEPELIQPYEYKDETSFDFEKDTFEPYQDYSFEDFDWSDDFDFGDDFSLDF